MSQDKFFNFMDGFAAAAELAKRAEDSDHYIEFICLSASLVDAMLRVGLVLHDQLETESESIPEELIHQADEDSIISERTVYRRGLEEGIIDQETFDHLERLYGDRNRVIHRYIISEITTDDVARIAREYKAMFTIISLAVDALERRQLAKGVGMTRRRSEGFEKTYKTVAEMSAQKHGSPGMVERIRRKAT